MTTPMMKSGRSCSEWVSDTVPNRLMCWISCSDVCVTFYRLVYRDRATINTIRRRQSTRQSSTVVATKSQKKGGQTSKWGNNVIFINCHGLALLVGPLEEARRVVLLLGGVVLGVENGRHFKNFYSATKQSTCFNTTIKQLTSIETLYIKKCHNMTSHQNPTVNTTFLLLMASHFSYCFSS
jgi:hypothetical protein